MGEEKDLGIKLFGKKIVLTENENFPAISGQDSGQLRSGVDNFRVEDKKEAEMAANEVVIKDKYGTVKYPKSVIGYKKDVRLEKNLEKLRFTDHVEGQRENKPKDKADLLITEDSKVSPEYSDSPKTPSINEEIATIKPPNTDTEQSDTTDSQQKTLKKPDKILPCPRCNSMDTKFCYYNNYNVSQPRHFCKSCQRYWTAGGTMRNMPVGAGRRKNKSSDSNSRHVNVSEALRATQINTANGMHNTTLKNRETVLSFGAHSLICEPVSSVLSVTGKKVQNSIQNEIYKQGISVPCNGRDYIDDCSSGYSTKNLNAKMEGKIDGIAEPVVQSIQGFSSQVPVHPVLPWPCPWNSTVPMQAICPPGFPFPCYPTPYWNYSVPGSWNMPWLPPPPQVKNQDAPICDSKSQILGKHSREGDFLRPVNYLDKEHCKLNNVEKSVVVPKIMRIDDLDEEAKGSIFASLGIKNDTITKAFQPKKDEKDHVVKPSPVLQANPAAMSRSLRFQERV